MSRPKRQKAKKAATQRCGDKAVAPNEYLHLIDVIRRARLHVRQQLAECSNVIMKLFRGARLGGMIRPVNVSNVPLAVRWPAILGLLGI